MTKSLFSMTLCHCVVCGGVAYIAYSSNKIDCSKPAFQAAEYNMNKQNINTAYTYIPRQDMRLLPSAPFIKCVHFW